MLLTFELNNYLSFKEPQVFSMISDYSRAEIFQKNTLGQLPSGNKSKKQYVLNSAVLYGSNAGGKTNFISGLTTLQKIVKDSFDHSDLTNIKPFKFTRDKKPTKFCITFLTELSNEQGYKMKYSIAIQGEKVIEERLTQRLIKKTTLSKEEIIFFRENDEIVDYALEVKELVEHFQTRNIDNKVLLSSFIKGINQSYFNETIKTLNYRLIENSYKFIADDLIFAKSSTTKQNIAEKIQQDKNFKQNVLDALKDIDIEIADFEIRDITDTLIEDINNEDIPEDVKEQMIEISRKRKVFDIKTLRDINGDNYGLEFYDESRGTIKFINDFIQIFDCIENNRVYIVDELENHYHPLIQRYILDLFLNQDDEKKTQIVFATHNTDFLESKKFAKEQIWFVDKDRETKASELFRLSEFEEISYDNHNWRNIYREGRLGAIPKVIF